MISDHNLKYSIKDQSINVVFSAAGLLILVKIIIVDAKLPFEAHITYVNNCNFIANALIITTLTL